MRRPFLLAAAILSAFVLDRATADDAADAKKAAPKMPNITGAWTGDWGAYDPAKGVALEKAKCKVLDCNVVLKENATDPASQPAGNTAQPAAGNTAAKVWEATFEGECGRPYKYTIKMAGRQASDVVLFQGTVDLGEKDGGVYDWIGRATDQEFSGFYTSSHHVGVFRLTKKK